MALKEHIGQAVGERIGEGGTGRLRAALTALVVGVAVAVITYRFLRGSA